MCSVQHECVAVWHGPVVCTWTLCVAGCLRAFLGEAGAQQGQQMSPWLQAELTAQSTGVTWSGRGSQTPDVPFEESTAGCPALASSLEL